MMNCTHCGSPLHEGDRFCWKCGQNTPDSQGEKEETPLTSEGRQPTDVAQPAAPAIAVGGVAVNQPQPSSPAAKELGLGKEPNFFDRKEKEVPQSELVPPSAERSKQMLSSRPSGIVEEKEEFVWHGRRSLLEFIAQWCLAALFCVLGMVVLIWRVPLADSLAAFFKVNQPIWYTIWGWVALALFAVGVFLVLMIFYYVLGSYYRLTTQRFIRQRGFIARKIDYVELMRVRDMGVDQSFLDRIFDVGDLQILSSERLVPDVKVNGIRRPYVMLEEIRRRVIHARAVRGVGILEVDK
ncbi:MAG: PH domain-containing protein [Coprothermobacterota bacterium]|nr:PH domain-containing protein [Coprothermobacterota bacterium]